MAMMTGTSTRRWIEADRRIRQRESYACCGETFVGALAAENHAVFVHNVPRDLARELISRA